MTFYKQIHIQLSKCCYHLAELSPFADNAAIKPGSSPQHLWVQWAAVSPEAPPVDPCLPAEVSRSDLLHHFDQQLPALQEEDAALRRKSDALEESLNTMPPELSSAEIPDSCSAEQLAHQMQVTLRHQFALTPRMTSGCSVAIGSIKTKRSFRPFCSL